MPKLSLYSHEAHIFGGDGLWLQNAQIPGMENVSCSVNSQAQINSSVCNLLEQSESEYPSQQPIRPEPFCT